MAVTHVSRAASHSHSTRPRLDMGGNVPANLFLFANYKTGDIAAFYSRQGST